MNVKTNVTWQGQVELFDLISQIGMSCFQKFLLFQNAFLINNINQRNLGKSYKKIFLPIKSNGDQWTYKEIYRNSIEFIVLYLYISFYIWYKAIRNHLEWENLTRKCSWRFYCSSDLWLAILRSEFIVIQELDRTINKRLLFQSSIYNNIELHRATKLTFLYIFQNLSGKNGVNNKELANRHSVVSFENSSSLQNKRKIWSFL